MPWGTLIKDQYKELHFYIHDLPVFLQKNNQEAVISPNMGICGEKFIAFICSNEIPHMLTNKILLTAIAVMFCFSLNAQTINPVKWDYSIKKINKSEAMVCLHAKIDKGWRIYSQNTGDEGPIKTELRFKSSKDYELKGKTIEPGPITKYSEAFDMNISYFETEVTFMQKVRIKKYGAKITGYIKYMVENDSMSVPPDDARFSITL